MVRIIELKRRNAWGRGRSRHLPANVQKDAVSFNSEVRVAHDFEHSCPYAEREHKSEPNKDPQPHGRRLRKGRVSIAGQSYLVTFTTHQRVCLFERLEPARVMVRALNEAPEVTTWCFVVMPDHVHWLLQLSGERPLTRVVQSVKSLATKSIKTRDPRVSQVWQRGFHDHAIRSQEALREIARYVIMNPVRARLVARVSDYPHWDAMWI
jgi:REP element-mobilizing transposase RayT